MQNAFVYLLAFSPEQINCYAAKPRGKKKKKKALDSCLCPHKKLALGQLSDATNSWEATESAGSTPAFAYKQPAYQDRTERLPDCHWKGVATRQIPLLPGLREIPHIH